MWILVSIALSSSIVTSIPDFTSKESCMEMREKILSKIDVNKPAIYCFYSED